MNDDENFLIEKLQLPINRILIGKAQRAEYEKQWRNSVRLWIEAKQWRRAHDTFFSFVFHEILLDGSFEFGKNVLDALDHQRANISHWNRRGGFIRFYIELLILIEKIHHGQVRSNRRYFVSFLFFFFSTLSSLFQTNLSHRNQTNLLTLVFRLSDQLKDVIGENFLKKFVTNRDQIFVYVKFSLFFKNFARRNQSTIVINSELQCSLFEFTKFKSR